jgi:hypothetical protein
MRWEGRGKFIFFASRFELKLFRNVAMNSHMLKTLTNSGDVALYIDINYFYLYLNRVCSVSESASCNVY